MVMASMVLQLDQNQRFNRNPNLSMETPSNQAFKEGLGHRKVLLKTLLPDLPT
jgi:hypothetical protein